MISHSMTHCDTLTFELRPGEVFRLCANRGTFAVMLRSVWSPGPLAARADGKSIESAVLVCAARPSKNKKAPWHWVWLGAATKAAIIDLLIDNGMNADQWYDAEVVADGVEPAATGGAR